MIKIKGIKSTIDSIKRQNTALVETSKLAKMEQLVDILKDKTPVDTGEAKAGWRIEKSSIINEVEHIKYLNEGSSVQAPAHFIEQAVLSQQGISPSGIIVVDK